MRIFLIILALTLFQETLLAESGFGVIEQEQGSASPFSPKQAQKLNTCYVRITASALAEQKKCAVNNHELDCKKYESCKWQSAKRACWGTGIKQCYSVLQSLCSQILEVSIFPPKEEALRRYECDPNSSGRIIKTANEE